MKRIFVGACFFVSCKAKHNTAEELKQVNELLPVSNWQVVHGNDTSYVMIGPVNDGSYENLHYKVSGGDTTQTQPGKITVIGEHIQWKQPLITLQLQQVKAKRMIWANEKGNEVRLLVKSDSVMHYISNEDTIHYTKTLPLATFLVRVRQDFKQGSKLVDSSEARSVRLRLIDSMNSEK